MLAERTAIFLWGATATACLLVSFLLWQRWRLAKDRLLALFATAFLALFAHWTLLALRMDGLELNPWVFSLRVIAFALIAVAVMAKNL